MLNDRLFTFVISRETTVSAFLITCIELVVICGNCESKQVLIVFVITFELDCSVVQFVGYKAEPTSRFPNHDVNSQYLDKPNQFVQKLLNYNLKVKDFIGDQKDQAHEKRCNIEWRDNVGAPCLELVWGALSDRFSQQNNGKQVEHQTEKDNYIIADIESDHLFDDMFIVTHHQSYRDVGKEICCEKYDQSCELPFVHFSAPFSNEIATLHNIQDGQSQTNLSIADK